jgi:glutaredoxin
MEIVHVPGENRGDIFIYALSTCGWCGKMKAWLNERGLEYRYVDVDQVPSVEEGRVMHEVRKWNPRCNFPTVVVNQKECFAGYQPERLAELLGL